MAMVSTCSAPCILGPTHNNYINAYLELSGSSHIEYYGGKLTAQKIRDPSTLKRYADFPARKVHFPRYFRAQPAYARGPFEKWSKLNEKQQWESSVKTVPRHQELQPINEPRSPRTRIHPNPKSYTAEVGSVTLAAIQQSLNRNQGAVASMAKTTDFFRSSHKLQRIKDYRFCEDGTAIMTKTGKTMLPQIQ